MRKEYAAGWLFNISAFDEPRFVMFVDFCCDIENLKNGAKNYFALQFLQFSKLYSNAIQSTKCNSLLYCAALGYNEMKTNAIG